MLCSILAVFNMQNVLSINITDDDFFIKVYRNVQMLPGPNEQGTNNQKHSQLELSNAVTPIWRLLGKKVQLINMASFPCSFKQFLTKTTLFYFFDINHITLLEDSKFF